MKRLVVILLLLVSGSFVRNVDGAQLDLDLRSNEPTIAVNPFNANNIVVANYDQGRQRLKISTDGGANFFIIVSAVRPAGQTFSQGDDSLAFDAQGRLFWSYLTGGVPAGPNVVVQQVDPITGNLVGLPHFAATNNLDKAWIAADSNPASPFANNLYIVWTDFNQPNAAVRFARSSDQGVTWTAIAGNISAAGSGFTWPPEVAVGPNGDVWAAWHVNSGATTGGVRLRRSTDGGVTFGPELLPFPNGTAAVTFNSATGLANKVAGMHMWLQGAVQPRILIDPVLPNTLYIVCANDPDGVFNPLNDPSDIVLARSTDNGATWTRSTISQGISGDSEIMPAAAIDASGRIAVSWYDNRRRLTAADTLGGTHFLLDVFTTTSNDSGLTFSAPLRLNGVSFDPETAAPDRFGNHTMRIGEYNGLSIGGDVAHAVWTGNRTTPSTQGTFYDSFAMPALATPTTTTVSPVAGQYSDVVTLSAQVQPTGAGGSVSFSVDGGAPISATYNSTTGVATAGYTIPLGAGVYTATAAFTSSGALFTNSSGSADLTVSRENAIVTPSSSNAASILVASPGGASPAFTLTAAITEVGDGSLGNISNAVPVSFTLTPVLTGAPVACTASTSGGGVGGTLNASCTFSGVPVNLYAVAIAIGGTYYTGSGTSVVSVNDPSLGFVTGGGTVVHDGSVANFGFNAKFLKNGQIQGSLLFVEHRTSGDVVVKSDALGTLAMVGNSAAFTGKATVGAVGNYQFQATVVDNGEPGVNDRFGLQIVQPNGTLQADLTFAQRTINSGNIQVHRGK